MGDGFPIGFGKCGDEIRDKFILRFLREGHLNQPKPLGCIALPDVLGETVVAGETQVVLFTGQTIKLAVFDSQQMKGVNLIRLVANLAQGSGKFQRQIFVDENFQATVVSCCRASSLITP